MSFMRFFVMAGLVVPPVLLFAVLLGNILFSDEHEVKAAVAAIENRDLDVIEQLISDGLDLDSRMNDGGTILLHAVYVGASLEIVNTLLTHGADANIGDDRDGLTPIMIAVSFQKKEILDLLLKFNADPNQPDSYGKSALDRAYESGLMELFSQYIAENKRHR